MFYRPFVYRLFVCVFVGFVCVFFGTAQAADVVLRGLPAGTVYLRVTTANGTTTAVRVPSVTVGTTTTPTDPVDPQPDLAKAAQTAAEAVARPSEAAALAAVYSAVAGEIRAGNVDASKAGENTKTAVDTVLGVMRAADRWKPWRAAMTTQLQAMDIRTGSELADAYEALAAGLNTAAGGANSAIDFQVIIKLVLAILSKNPAAIAEAVLALVQSLRT